MAALDTNVVVRLIIGDDAAQARVAEALVASEPCTVAPSVLMECVWVLRASYRLDAPLIASCLRDLLALQNIDAIPPCQAGIRLHALIANQSSYPLDSELL